MNIEPLEGPIARASERAKLLGPSPFWERHSLRYCGYCFRSFGIDVLTALGCTCGRYDMHSAGGTKLELEFLEQELTKERDKHGINQEKT